MQGEQVTWVVGASSGIGAALVDRLVERGHRVVISARRAERLEARAADSPGQVLPLPVDVTDLASMRAAVAHIEREWGPVGVAVLNAGDYRPMELADFDPEAFARLMMVNFQGVVHGLDALRVPMLTRGRGQILVMGSVAGYRGLPYAAPYGASKAALINMTESLAPEFARGGVRLRIVNPGFVRTALTAQNDFEMPGLIEPAEAAAAIVRALDRPGFEIRTPRLFTWFMRRITRLPYALWFPLARRMLRE
ncbi:MAG: SDR family NAD(P)-dependent oxidoreductase [Halothiobacillaceae bacterium]